MEIGHDQRFQVWDRRRIFLVDAGTKCAARAMPSAFLKAAKRATGGQVSGELLQSQVEISMLPHTDTATARAELRFLRQTVAEIAAGTHPTAAWRDMQQTESEPCRAGAMAKPRCVRKRSGGRARPSSHAANLGARDAMTRPARQKESRSLRLYARLLELYPPAFLQQHRAEMLQNFTDLEGAAESKAPLWLLIRKGPDDEPHFALFRVTPWHIRDRCPFRVEIALHDRVFPLRQHARPSGFA
jgi:hypothetical protein